jgi:rhodanese-related sulfurtransferase
MGAGEQPREIDVDPAGVAEWMAAGQPPQVIDVREPHEREAGHIEGTRHIPLAELTAQADTVERERPVVFYCRVGARSTMAAQAFRASGFEAYSMTGGLLRWAAEGRALVPEGGHVADH